MDYNNLEKACFYRNTGKWFYADAPFADDYDSDADFHNFLVNKNDVFMVLDEVYYPQKSYDDDGLYPKLYKILANGRIGHVTFLGVFQTRGY